jgi:hypothetical protein
MTARKFFAVKCNFFFCSPVWPSKPTHHKTESVFKVTMSALGPILASLSSVTSMATVLADTVAQNHNLNERLQKQLAAKVERCIRETVAEQQATEYVQAHPDHVLEHKLPGLFLGKCEGDLSTSEQKNKCKRLISVFNLLLKNDTLTQAQRGGNDKKNCAGGQDLGVG